MKYLIFVILFLVFGQVSAQSHDINTKKVLFVMSATSELPLNNGKIYDETGVFLSEFYLPYQALIKVGYAVDFATPDGKKPPIDQESLKKKYWKKNEHLLNEANTFVANDVNFAKPLMLEHLTDNELNAYSALIIPGGQGLMVDLMANEKIPSLLMHFHRHQKPIGLICHAPALLLTFDKQHNPFKGYQVNSVTGIEELFIEKVVMKGKPHIRKIGKQLSQNGMIYKKDRPAANFAIRDRMLISSQNPYSNEKFIELFLESLVDYEKTQQKPYRSLFGLGGWGDF